MAAFHGDGDEPSSFLTGCSLNSRIDCTTESVMTTVSNMYFFSASVYMFSVFLWYVLVQWFPNFFLVPPLKYKNILLTMHCFTLIIMGGYTGNIFWYCYK
jgi:hypothetical protein